MHTKSLQRVPLVNKYYYISLYVLKGKFGNMNLKFKSTDADLKFNIQTQLTIINKNILYLTRQTDLCVKWLKEFRTDENLQKQVDQYFDEGAETVPGLPDTRTPEH